MPLSFGLPLGLIILVTEVLCHGRSALKGETAFWIDKNSFWLHTVSGAGRTRTRSAHRPSGSVAPDAATEYHGWNGRCSFFFLLWSLKRSPPCSSLS